MELAKFWISKQNVLFTWSLYHILIIVVFWILSVNQTLFIEHFSYIVMYLSYLKYNK